MDGIFDVLTVAIVFFFVFGMPIVLVWIILEFRKNKNRHNERMSLISQGIIPEEEVKRKRNPNRFVSLRNGIVLIGLAIGILVGFTIAQNLALSEETAFWIYSASILLFLGIGYLVYFFVTRNITMNDFNNNLVEE